MSIMYPLGCCRAWEAEVEVKGYIDLDHHSIVAMDTVVERLHGPLSSQMFKQRICSSGRSLGELLLHPFPKILSVIMNCKLNKNAWQS